MIAFEHNFQAGFLNAVAASGLALATALPRAMAGPKLALTRALDVLATWAMQSISYPTIADRAPEKSLPRGGEEIFEIPQASWHSEYPLRNSHSKATLGLEALRGGMRWRQNRTR